jgi:hypothetical protein
MASQETISLPELSGKRTGQVIAFSLKIITGVY